MHRACTPSRGTASTFFVSAYIPVNLEYAHYLHCTDLMRRYLGLGLAGFPQATGQLNQAPTEETLLSRSDSTFQYRAISVFGKSI